MKLLFACVALIFSGQLFAYGELEKNISFEALSFAVYLDNKEAGTHNFILEHQGERTKVSSDLKLQIKIWGLLPVEYHHQATEYWQNGCLESLSARTSKRGKIWVVDGRSNSLGLTIKADNISRVYGGCIRSFAYWDASLLEGDQLLNSETGELLPVQVKTIDIQDNGARSLLIDGTKADIYLEYGADGQWLSLKSRLKVGGELHYIRQP